jgi:hypothetical protein
MECVYYGNSTQYGRGAGKGPWVMADMENGMWPGDTKVWVAAHGRTHAHSDSCAPLDAVAHRVAVFGVGVRWGGRGAVAT